MAIGNRFSDTLPSQYTTWTRGVSFSGIDLFCLLPLVLFSYCHLPTGTARYDIQWWWCIQVFECIWHYLTTLSTEKNWSSMYSRGVRKPSNNWTVLSYLEDSWSLEMEGGARLNPALQADTSADEIETPIFIYFRHFSFMFIFFIGI